MTPLRAVLDRTDLNPGGTRARRALHEEELAGGAVRIALHDHRAIAQVRQQRIGHVRVVLEQVALGQPELGPEDLAQVGQPDVLPIDGEDDVVLARGNQETRHLRGGSLGGRAPRRTAPATGA